MEIKRIDPLQAGKVMGVLYFFGSLFLAVPFFFISRFLPTGPEQPALPIFFTSAFAIAMPFLYGALGFVTTALAAAVYNTLVKFTGGIRIETSVITGE